ncbi:enoyl-CoA hydratase/isomerase family protein [Massilia oculi]|uniref:Enoyl-CoA hydratase/isomerase family protein n=1 Tax=Massilia hydrophila TaxID=3044279 RepID=A0ABS7YDC3_9BURK|nr:enoyl-CoA hydratase/isomerase family protein [Massilia oculi]MCA1857368.1 enoyl-CoA hydratase/isomerase family protein [Massilia oculi]
MTEQLISLSIEDGCAELRIERPHKRNALTRAMWGELHAALGAVARSSAHLLVLRGSGGVFSAGADIEEMGAFLADPVQLAASNALVRDTQLALERLSCMTLAVVEGACVGGGCGLALACDFRLATENARFAITPARLGLLYSAEDVRRVVGLVGAARARQLLLTAQPVDAATALGWGMLTEVCDAAGLDERIAAWRALAAEVSPNSVAGIKRSIGMLGGAEPADFQALAELFEAAFVHPDFREGARAFLEKRAPRFHQP